jgi:hypothetical protein
VTAFERHGLAADVSAPTELDATVVVGRLDTPTGSTTAGPRH